MQWFNRLPGFYPSSPGLERVILRRLPAAAIGGSVALLLAILGTRLLHEESWRAPLSMPEIYLASLFVPYWSALLACAIAAFIVMVMKGPAYVADAYFLPDADEEGRKKT